MKLIFAAEDTIIGIICGILLIGLAGRFFELKLPDNFYLIAFIIYSVAILMDIVNEARDLTTHFGFILFSLIHSFVDLAIALAFVSHFSSWNMPIITSTIVPYLASQSIIFGIGAYLVIGNVVWLALYPFLD